MPGVWHLYFWKDIFQAYSRHKPGIYLNVPCRLYTWYVPGIWQFTHVYTRYISQCYIPGIWHLNLWKDMYQAYTSHKPGIYLNIHLGYITDTSWYLICDIYKRISLETADAQVVVTARNQQQRNSDNTGRVCGRCRLKPVEWLLSCSISSHEWLLSCCQCHHNTFHSTRCYSTCSMLLGWLSTDSTRIMTWNLESGLTCSSQWIWVVSFYKTSSKSIESFHSTKLRKSKCKLNWKCKTFLLIYNVCLRNIFINCTFINNQTSLVHMWKSIKYSS